MDRLLNVPPSLILLVLTLIVSLIRLSVIPGAGLCLGQGENSNCEK